MRIRYTNTAADVIKGQYAVSLIGGQRYFWLALAAGLFVIAVVSAGNGPTPPSLGFRLMYAAIVVAGWGVVAVGAIFCGAILRLIFSRGRGVVGEHELIISEEGFEECTAFNRTLSPWSAVRGLTQSGSFHLLEVGRGVHLVPKRRPLIEGDRDAFIVEFKKRAHR